MMLSPMREVRKKKSSRRMFKSGIGTMTKSSGAKNTVQNRSHSRLFWQRGM
ncbi:uncharacterized protein METZ01_LOCUS5555 [marine metagenome]|uniref:Uncharacterized protein n=1 Tax=marine metagenome TaxID=408172 RepID=A0A381NDN6_9ZZZZ